MRTPQTGPSVLFSIICGALALSFGACAYSPASMPKPGSGGGSGSGSGGVSGSGSGGSTGSGGVNIEPSGNGGSDASAGGGAGGTTDAASGSGGAPAGAKNPNLTYTKIVIHNRFLAESVAIGDFDHDGTLDIAAGKRWYKGPFDPGYNPADPMHGEHIYRDGHDDLPVSGTAEEINTGVSDSWSAFGYDFNGDGWDDIFQHSASDIGPVTSGQTKPIPAGTGYWFQNPKGGAGNWPKFQVSADMKGEHKFYADMDKDGKPEILGACKNCSPPETWGYWQANWTNPSAPWTFHSVTRMYPFKDNCCGWLHGLGAGDVDGDGRMDLLERSGIWLQPATATDKWTFINIAFSIPEHLDTAPDIGGSHIQVYDVDDDGMNDIITSSNSHGYGLAWFRQGPKGTFTRNMIMDIPAANAAHDNTVYSQLHSLWLEDMDGDGLKDIVTGKTFLAHPFTTGDAGGSGSAGVGTEPTVLYVYKLIRTPTVKWEPHLIDIDKAGEKASGVAREFRVADMNKDGIPDIVISSKRGLFVFKGKP